MPGRVSTRSTVRPSTATTASRKSSTQAPDNTQASSVEDTGPVGGGSGAEDATPPSQLRLRVCRIFADCQHTTASHRKLVNNLRRIQEECCYEPSSGARRSNKTKATADSLNTTDDHFDEQQFNDEVERCITRVMGVKKSEAVGDRIVRFLGLFLRHASDKDAAMVGAAQNAMSDEAEDAYSDTPSTRLTSRILSTLLSLLSSKEKQVRYRATQIISHVVNSVDSIDDDLFQSIRLGLLKRLRDKEAMVRVQAVLGLGRLAGNEIDGDQDEERDDDDEDQGGLLERLLRVLQHDPSADVRRSLLLNMPLTPATLPFLLERSRDQDGAIRRALYSRLLPAFGDFRHLSLSMREKLLRWGLRDRDEHVRKAAAKLFREIWIEDCAGTRGGVEKSAEGTAAEAAGGKSPSVDALLELLERIDVVNSGAEDGVALEAMRGFWEGRADYREAVTFEDSFWEDLCAESAFMARTFNDYCRLYSNGRLDGLVDEKIPEVSRLAYHLHRHINTLMQRKRNAPSPSAQGEESGSAEVNEDDEDAAVEQEFIVEQLLHIAKTLDYSDEAGRRKMFALMREALAMPDLPEEATTLVVELLGILCGDSESSEREFCAIVLEAVAEVHDSLAGYEDGVAAADDAGDDNDDSFHSAGSEMTESSMLSQTGNRGSKKKGGKQQQPSEAEDEAKAIQQIIVNMKCLHIAQCMLQNVQGLLQHNTHLVGMLNNLVVPAVRSHEAPLRERGLVCLGLCCLLDKTLAEENLTLFLHCFNKGHDALQVYALHILSDILMAHGNSIVLENAGLEHGKPVFKVFSKGLKAADRADVQSAACTALCKLMLGGVFQDDDLLKSVVVAYFDPDTAGNLALRQALTYFLPVYCHSRRDNQERMRRVAVAALRSLMVVHENLDDDDDDMVGLNVIAAHLVDWTDPLKLVVATDSVASATATATATKMPGVTPADEPSINAARRKDAVNTDVHLDLAEDVLERICSTACNREEEKLLASMLGKLSISANTTQPEKLDHVLDMATRAGVGTFVTKLRKLCPQSSEGDADAP